MRSAVVFVTVVAVLVGVAACSSEKSGAPAGKLSVSAKPTFVPPTGEEEPAVKMKQPFRNGAFQVVVTSVKLGVNQIDLDATAEAGGLKPYTPENGQYVMVYLTAKNVGSEPATMSTTSSSFIDDKGREFASAGALLGGVMGQGLDQAQQPDTNRSGWIAFDVPPTVTGVSALVLQSDALRGHDKSDDDGQPQIGPATGLLYRGGAGPVSQPGGSPADLAG